MANVILLMIMLGAVYTHYVLHDKFERMAPGLVFSLLLVTRLIIYRQVTHREKKQNLTKTDSNKKSKVEESEEASESGDADSASEQEDKKPASNDKKSEKKKNK